ncbi:FAD dependent oxidoreductase [Microstroma glucosiphilum]|uniref:FAD dependent oxidoreductase n=1 Tax=Pseudomicrostroma glucosiphilum TaxID=1684307 RepID=A0A316UKE1_9BASI|nr:FAD dependent oxidoreductase [Pseudomicrostroma glucosiphilum]PWN23695.1 FAD dependent oxidoreductase [Pseudomicrostroma glucosiphilum]
MASTGRESLAVKRATEVAFDSAPTEPAPLPCPHPLPSYWTQTSSEPGPAQGVFTPQDGVDMEPEVDVAIIGAGITGISAAYHLANRLTPRYDGQPIKVVVLEARDFCSGATGRNGGHLTPLSVLSYDELASNPAHLSRFLSSTSREEHWGNDRGTKTDEVIRKILTLEARTSAEILMIIQEGDSLDVELVSGSNWHLCQSSEEEAAFDASIERAKRAGLSDLAMQVKKVPSEEWHKRLHDPSKITAVYEIPGSTVHSRRLVLLLHQLAYANAQRSKTDLKVFTQTPVLAVKSLSGGASSLETPRGNVRARYVIHATNAYASHLLPQYAGPKGIVPTRAQCVSVLPSKSPSEGEPLWQMGFSLNHGFEYLQQRPNRSTDGAVQTCILGGGRWAAIDREWGVADDTKTNPDVSAVLRPMLSDLFPNNFSKGDPVELEWTGIIGHSKSGDPFVGPVVASAPASHGARQYIVAGYSGHGMTRAYSCAEVVVDMIVADRAGEEWVPPVW